MSTNHSIDGDPGDPFETRGTAAILVGFAGALICWWVTPFNNFVIGSSYIADSYLPVIVLFVTVVLVLLLNPLLRRALPGLALGQRQLAVIVGIMLVACYLPSSGLHRMLPYSLVRIPPAVAESRQLGDIYAKMNLPPSLFPDPVAFGARTPASDQFLAELAPGAGIPWMAWLKPCLSWGTFNLCCCMMMVGLAMLVWPQWRNNERLPFPLLTVQQALLDAPGENRLFAPLFRSRPFWIAAGGVFFLHFLAGANTYNPERVPTIPLRWDLSPLFTEEPLVFVPYFIKSSRIYFLFLGVAFFMPNRIGFSIWFFEFAYAAYQVIRRAYTPPFHWGTIGDHRTGTMLALTVGILWVGRAHWLQVIRSCARRGGSARDRYDRRSGYLFLFGCVGMFAWLVWAGVSPLWSLWFVLVGFIACLLVTRVVAETGLAMLGLDTYSLIYLIKLAPVAWLTNATIFFASVINMIFAPGSRVCCTTLAVHGLGLDEQAKPARQARLGFVFLSILAIGFVISGAFHLDASYHHSTTLDGQEQPISRWGTGRLIGANRDLTELNSGQMSRPPYNRLGHVAFGAALAGLLEWACLSMPRWWFHPVGLLGVYTWYINVAWVSIFLGWLAKILLVRYGGSRLYHAARPAFIGLIMGEVFAAIFWGLLLPATLVALGLPYKNVQVLPF
ncbi:MAG: hypothetical protein JXR37_31325 [Kiritimatiellae bacterium]|nr:hypothetical protein [Kiritimatiellia bacterium]